MKRRFANVSGMAMAVALTALLAMPAAAVDKVRIGAIYPLTGPAGSTGAELKDAITLAADIVNGKYDLDLPLARTQGLPNLKGAQVEVIFGDHQGKPDVGQAEAERMITTEKVVALMGAYHSSVTTTASIAAERHKVPFLNPESTDPKLTERGFRYFFRTTPFDDQFAENFFQFLNDVKKQKGAKISSVATVYENTNFGTGVNNAIRKNAAKYGYRLVADVAYAEKGTSAIAEVQKVKAAAPDVVMPASYTADAILYMKTFKDLNYAPQAILAMDAGYISDEFKKTLGKDGEYVLSREVWALDLAKKKPMIAKVNEIYKKRFGRDMNGNSARSFTGFLVLADAINRAGSTDPEKIREALEKYTLGGNMMIMPWDGVAFDPKTHQNTKGRGIIVQLVSGEWYTVWPFDLASRDVVWPMPAWGKR
ncbi:MAG TPA: ABC transporter substrate-binding protein [Candidatus Deferrimicrobium sp.]|jgi:branched-chain amino acid transport system substrate-binding protein